MDFEWDENKRKTNIEKHQVDFNDAVFVFIDGNRWDTIDDGI